MHRIEIPDFNNQLADKPSVMRTYNEKGDLTAETNLGYWHSGLGVSLREYEIKDHGFEAFYSHTRAVSDEREVDELGDWWRDITLAVDLMGSLLDELPRRFRPLVERCVRLFNRLERALNRLADRLPGDVWHMLAVGEMKSFRVAALEVWRLTGRFFKAMQVVFCTYRDRRRRLDLPTKERLSLIFENVVPELFRFESWTGDLRNDALYVNRAWN